MVVKHSSTVDHFYSNREIPEGVLYTRDEYGKNGLLLRSDYFDDGILEHEYIISI